MRDMLFLTGLNRNLGVTRFGLPSFPPRFLAILCLLAAGFLSAEMPAQAAPLFPQSDANWRWRPGTNEASAPIAAWRTNGFNDAEFVTAPAPFWYGDVLPGGTVISGMQNVYLCIFLRKTFVVTNVAEIATLRLGALVDDGFTAWINGAEVQRVNMLEPAGTDVTITNLAANAVENPGGGVPFLTYTLTNPGSYLVVGTNTFAVQVLQSSLGSSDLGFDASLDSVVVETNPPTVASASPSGGSTLGALTSISVTFSEPVTGVDAGDFLVNGTPANSLTAVNSSNYLFSFTQPAFGTVQISWTNTHGITDQAVPPNPFDATGAGATWAYTLRDQVAPTVASLSPAANATVASLTNLGVLFSENVSGVDAADLLINNTPATGLIGAGNTYTFSFPQPAAGLVQVAWAAGHAITDQAASPNAFVPGGSWFYTLNTNVVPVGGPVISEFLAANTNSPTSLLDEDNDSSDWIEIQNTAATAVDLLDWSLTDNAGNLTKWRFPGTNLPSGGFLVVFASQKNRQVPGARLHTNFKLGSSGGYLALVRPNGSIASEFNPYPQQIAGVSFGLGVLSTNSTLVSTTALARVQIPSSNADATNWLYPGFNDAAWTAGTNGVGFGSTNVTQADYSAAVLPTGPLVYYRMSEIAGTTVANLGTLGASANGTYVNSPTLNAAGPRPPAFSGFEADNRAVQLIGTANTDFVQGPAGLLTSRSAFTIAGWIRPTAAQAGRTGLFGQNDTVEFGFISAGVIQAWTPSGSIGSYTYPFPDNEWHLMALVSGGGQFTIYLDGISRISAAAVAGAAAGTFNIGGGGIFDPTGNDFVGQMDEICMWDRALSAGELAALYTAGTTPAGFPVTPFVKTDVGPAMSNVNASAYIRLPFTIDDPSNVQLLTMKLRYDDGFVAYVNGIEVVRANAPGALAYDSAATAAHSPAFVDTFTIGAGVLRAGANVLAIQGMNASRSNDDFLIVAELTATHVAAASTTGLYMTGPTPGAANAGGVTVLGPAITEFSHTPKVPLDPQDIVVSARVSPTFAAIGSVAVRYRVMFNAEITLPMNDSGTNGDLVAGDGVYGCTLPIAASSTNGQMIRWYFLATDALGRSSRWPLFPTGGDEEYLGTVVDPSYLTSQLPIFHFFVGPTQVAGIDSESGGRFSAFYDGEFYDNAYMELRGNTSAGLPKKAHRMEWNRNHEFRHPGPGGRVRKSSLLAEYPDPSRLRQHLCFWFLDKIGVPSPFDYPVRVQTNGAFFQVAMHNDVIGQEQIERMGYDPKGALYKAVGQVLLSRASTGVFQKLEPDEAVPNYTDYNQVANGIVETATLAARRAAVFDLFDVPEVINHLVGARWCSENDDVWANMSLYRDTFGDQLWRCIPFDMNASCGQRYGGNNPLEAAVDTQKSHPLYGGRAITPAEGGPGYNRIYDVIISMPETREMYLRRMRSALDLVVQPPGTPTNQLIIENYIKSLTNLMAADMLLDNAKWPAYSAWGPAEPFVAACTNLMFGFVGPRRQHWYGTHCITNTARPTGTNSSDKAGIPLSQPAQPPILIGAIEFNPANSNQLQEYICLTNPNPYAVDMSGWKLSGGAQFTFKPGTIMPSNSVLYVSPNVVAFKQRTVGPRGGQGLFVVGPYDGQLNARGESLALKDDTGFLITSNSFIGVPSPAQLYLRVTEIMYNPSPFPAYTNDLQQFEYIELKNISGSVTLNLGGVRLTNGVDFNFTGSAVTSLAPGASVLVVRNTNAFAARYGGGLPVAGQFSGALDSNGEVIRLDDATGEKVLEFDYNNTWYPITDGHGFSLVIVDENAPWDTWGMKSSWRPSGSFQGSPGVVDPPPPVIASILVNEVLTHTDLPLVDRVELWNPTASPVNIGGWLLTDDFTNAHKYRFPDPTTIAAGSYLTVDEGQFNTPTNAPDSFAFGSDGDEVYLFSADPATTNLTGYFHGFDFGAAESGVSFGRYTNSQTNVHFVAQSAITFGAPNALPKVGPVVLSEVMFHPPEVTAGVDNVGDEFIEVLNISGVPVPLFHPSFPSNTWRLSSAVNFDFPTNVTLAASGTAIIVGFNPSNAALASAFRTRFGVPGGVPLLGPWAGKLDNSGESVRLYQPDAPVLGVAPYVLVDRVDYSDAAPWPVAADGLGGSLQRIVRTDYGNDVTNWIGAAPTGGGAFVPGTPPTITAPPSGTSVAVGGNAMLSVSVSGTPPFAYQWQFNSNNLPGANSSVLLLNNLQLSNSGPYRVIVLGAGGSAVSANALLNVFLPATLTQQPANQFFNVPPDPRTPTNPASRVATFRVVVNSLNPPLTYQWRLNGTNLVPGADTNIAGITTDTLMISNVVLPHAGWYSCVITDTRGPVVSSEAVLGVKPYLLVPPGVQIIANGSPISVSAIIQGFPAPHLFQWRRSNVNIGVETNSQSTTTFATFNSGPAGFTNNLGSISNGFNLRLFVTNLTTGIAGETLSNLPGWGPGINNIFVVADTDGDGIPNYVETALGLDPNSAADGLLDLDGDGMRNVDEYRAGTEINNSNSVLRVTQTTAPGQAIVSFWAVSNRTYTVQYSDVVPAVLWNRLADVVNRATSRTETFPDPGWTSNRFYRVITPRAP